MAAQDLKCICLYGRGFGLDLPEAPAEDLLIEGLWLFVELYALDMTAVSIVSYAAANSHAGLEEEIRNFEAWLPEEARRTAAYYTKVREALSSAAVRVREAAAATNAAPVLQSAPAPRQAASPAGKIAGDGFMMGWNWPFIPREGSFYARHLSQHGYTADRIFELAREAGIDYVRPDDQNVFDWPDVEKQPGSYDWTRVDEILALAKKHGFPIYLPIPLGTTAAPDWLTNRLGAAASLGTPAKVQPWEHMFFMGMPNTRDVYAPANLFNQEVAAAFARYVTALVRHVKNSGVSIVAVDLIGPRRMPDDFSDAGLKRWRSWLERKYGSSPLPWDSGMKPSEAALPNPDFFSATNAATRRQLLDYVKWREDDFCRYVWTGVEAVRQADPHVPITCFYGETMEFNDGAFGRHHEHLVQELGLVPFHFTPGHNFYDNLRRAYSPAGFSGCTTHTGSGNAFAQYAFSSFIHDSLVIHTWPCPIARGFYWGDCFPYPDLRWRWSALNSWRRFLDRAQGMAPEMLHTKPAPQVAMLWSDTTHKFQSFIKDWVGGTYGFRADAANYHRIGCIGWDRLLDGMGMNYDVVTEDGVRQGRLGSYSLLIMPSVQALPGDVAERIRAFAADGGLVVATSAAALYGEDMEMKGGGQLADVFGADFDRFLGISVVAETPMGTPRREGWIHPWAPNPQKAELGSDSMRTLFCCFKPRAGAQTLETFTSGEPAVISNSFGRGKAVIIGYPIGRQSFLSDVYHEHYGHNWADMPYGPYFHQELMTWLELLWCRIGFERAAIVAKETGPRAIGRDAGWPSLLWPQKNGGYPFFVWKTGAQGSQFAPRSVETAIRRGEGNPCAYLTIYNREGAYGYDPGVIHFESSSKELRIELDMPDVKRIYDLSLQCPVPFTRERSLDGRRTVCAFQTQIEPSMGKMFVVSTNETILLYEGRRERGMSDSDILSAVRRIASRNVEPPSLATLNEKAVLEFLAARAAKNPVISCESPLFLPAAERLSTVIGKALHATARISRTAPRITAQHGGINSCVENFEIVESPDIIIGNRNTSHHLAKEEPSYGLEVDHNPRVPFVTSSSMPGPGRSIIMLLRPYARRPAKPEENNGRLFVEIPTNTVLIISASEPAGMDKAIDHIEQLVKRARREARK